MDCSTSGFPVHYQLWELAQTRVHWIGDAIQPSHPLLVSFSSCLQSLPASGSFPMSQFLASGGQSIETSASVLPTNIQYSQRSSYTFKYCIVSKRKYFRKSALLTFTAKSLLRTYCVLSLPFKFFFCRLCLMHRSGTKKIFFITKYSNNWSEKYGYFS